MFSITKVDHCFFAFSFLFLFFEVNITGCSDLLADMLHFKKILLYLGRRKKCRWNQKLFNNKFVVYSDQWYGKYPLLLDRWEYMLWSIITRNRNTFCGYQKRNRSRKPFNPQSLQVQYYYHFPILSLLLLYLGIALLCVQRQPCFLLGPSNWIKGTMPLSYQIQPLSFVFFFFFF